MKNNKSLPYFIFGSLSVLIFIPLIESITELLCSSLEYPKAKIVQKVLKENIIINDLQAQSQNYDDPHRIGFQINDQEEYYDDDECDNKASNKSKNKVGF